MHWAPIPVTEFALPAGDYDATDVQIFRSLCRTARRGFWITALSAIALMTFGFVACAVDNPLAGALCIIFGMFAGTGHILIRHKLNLAIWIVREPAAVYWAELEHPNKPQHLLLKGAHALTLHTPAPVKLSTLVSYDELIKVLHWLRRRNPDALIGSFSPDDSDGKLSGTDPWSPLGTSTVSVDSVHIP